ncbi:MAG: hypothetical protein PHD31_03225 [Candidatus Pacebacteria bacterium]|nr:hypothetical protein [Candidatus Paceibacterota bacterium]
MEEEFNLVVSPEVGKKFVKEVENVLVALEKLLNLKTSAKIIITNREDIMGLYIPDENIILISEFGIKSFAEQENIPIHHTVLMNVLIHEIYHSVLKEENEEKIINLTDKAVEVLIEMYLKVIN